MPEILIRGNETHVIDLNPGGDSPIVMVHGLFTSLAVYYFTIAPKLAQNHRVVLYDLRGHGGSASCKQRFTLDDLLDDLLALKEHLGVGFCHLTGYSFGGALALYACAKHPEEFESLALIETPLFGEEHIERLLTSDLSDGAVSEGIKAYTKSTRIPVSRERAQKIQEQNRSLVEVGGLREVFTAGKEQLAALPFEQIALPVLLLYGKESELQTTGHFLRRRLPQATLCMAHGDHHLPVTRYSWVSRRLRHFFG